MKFTRYTNEYEKTQPLTIEQLKEINRDTGGDLLARAEFSGCEGCYIEIARWNWQAVCWERYAFLKVFGCEIEGIDNALGVAEKIALDINTAAAPHAAYSCFIHNLPNYSIENEKLEEVNS